MDDALQPIWEQVRQFRLDTGTDPTFIGGHPLDESLGLTAATQFGLRWVQLDKAPRNKFLVTAAYPRLP